MHSRMGRAYIINYLSVLCVQLETPTSNVWFPEVLSLADELDGALGDLLLMEPAFGPQEGESQYSFE